MKRYAPACVQESLYKKLMNYFKSSLDLSDKDIAKFSVGFTIVSFNLFELLLVIITAFLLGIIKEVLLFSIMFIPIRMLAAGVHCKSGHACIITTLIFYIGSSLLSKYFPIGNSYGLIIGFICLMVLFKYAPADTKNRPIIGEKHRKQIRIKTVSTALLILIISAFINSTIIINSAMYALLIESISILPLTYKLFNVNYKNYMLYEI